jgi:hypothetical protein
MNKNAQNLRVFLYFSSYFVHFAANSGSFARIFVQFAGASAPAGLRFPVPPPYFNLSYANFYLFV